ncbi:ABC transporter permease subunit [Pseudalkalibacillus sp. Hm43]|uniref:ABC transporter permease subunit n=1 Tax=Pseudalkalibacillus sp. Hm43 TaxID=3450742 RepID=UPI003F43D27C
MRTFGILVLEFFLTVIGILLLGKLPYLLFDMESLVVIQKAIDTGKIRNALYLSYDIGLYWEQYKQALLETGKQLSQLKQLTYYDNGYELPVFPMMWDLYKDSMKILGASFGLSLIVSTLLTYSIMWFMNVKVRKVFGTIINGVQIIPDVFLILFFQFLIIYIYRKTDVLLFDILSFNGDNAYLLPIICLSILPTVFLTKILLHIFEEEAEARYVETAKSKGVKWSRILIFHIFRNTVANLFYNAKTLFWFSLSALLMLEILFNMNGFTTFIWEHGIITPEVFIIGMFMLFFPFFFIFVIGGLIVSKYSLNQNEVFV